MKIDKKFRNFVGIISKFFVMVGGKSGAGLIWVCFAGLLQTYSEICALSDELI